VPSRKRYPREYVAGCRSRLRTQLAAYRQAANAARQPGEPKPAADTPFGLLEPVFFNNLLVVLDTWFVRRARDVEGRDGNPLNEVRLLRRSLTENGERLVRDRTVHLDPETSVLGHRPGDPVRLTEEQFTELAEAFLEEIEQRYVG
jgi:hypothetical protein